MVRELKFAACYVYSPHGSSAIAAQSRLARTFLKAGDFSFLQKCTGIVGRQVVDGCVLSQAFDGNPVLVPVPGSEPWNASALWVAERLCAALLRQGLGDAVWTVLRRTTAVRKSGTAASFDRPTFSNHYASLAVDGVSFCPHRILLVDDIVTKGRTLLAAAARLQQAFPAAQISAFAFFRTMAAIPEIGRLLDPCVGEIRWIRGDARRQP